MSCRCGAGPLGFPRSSATADADAGAAGWPGPTWWWPLLLLLLLLVLFSRR